MTNQENRIAIREAQGIESLVSVLRDRDTEVRKNAAAALWNVAVNAENQVLVARAGGIEPLVALLRDADTVVRQKAAGALQNVAVNAENKVLVARAGGIEPLVALLRDRGTEVRKQAAGALWNVTENQAAHQQELVNVDGLAILKQLISTERDATVKQNAEKVLSFCQHLSPLPKPPAIPVASPVKPSTIPVMAAPPPPAMLKSTSPLSTQTSSTGSSHSTPSTGGEPSFKQIPADKVTLGRELGRGGFGRVFEGTYQFRKVAVKCYDGAGLTPKVKREVEHEIGVMQRLDHEYLVRLLGVMQAENEPPMLVMEFGANGSLFAYLQSDETITWTLRLRMAEELARGLAYLHEERVIHRDIKSLNVVLDRDFHAKWCDFGLACLKLHTQSTSKVSAQDAGGGTLRWMAPELLADDEPVFSTASDIWAIGMVYFELSSRQIPYKTLLDPQVMKRLMEGKAETVPEACRYQSPMFATLIADCWKERTQRPSAAELVGRLSTINQIFEERPAQEETKPSLDSGFIGLSRR